MTTTTIDIMTTVALTRISERGHPYPQYATNDGVIMVWKQASTTALDGSGEWAVGRAGDERPFTTGLPSLEDAIDFILGARAMLAPADD